MAISNDLFYVGFFIALYAINIIGVWLVAWFLRRWISRLTLTWSLVASQTVLVLLIVALYPTGVFFAEPPVGDLYAGFFLFPGVHLYLLAGKLCLDPLMDHGFSNWLFQHFPELASNLIGLIFFPQCRAQHSVHCSGTESAKLSNGSISVAPETLRNSFSRPSRVELLEQIHFPSARPVWCRG